MQWVEGHNVQRFRSEGLEPRGSLGAYEFDVARLQKLAVIFGLAAVCWAPIVSLAVWLAQ